jgi:two-component system, sensor histidine kinase and response regulator
MDATDSAFEVRHLLNAVEGDATLARLVAKQFLADGHRLPQRLDSALGAGDAVAAARAAHELRGMAATLGAARLAGAAGALEAALRAGAQPPADGASALHTEWRQVADSLARFVGGA